VKPTAAKPTAAKPTTANTASLPPFEAVVADNGAVVLRVCRGLLSPADADDAWSDTFLSALQAYPGLPPGSNIRGWLVTIAHRKSIDIHRRRARAPVPVADLTAALDRHATSSEGVPGAAAPELWAAVAALPDRQRSAIVQHHLAGLPYAEIAALTGSSAAAVRRAAADGIAALRRHHLTGVLT